MIDGRAGQTDGQSATPADKHHEKHRSNLLRGNNNKQSIETVIFDTFAARKQQIFCRSSKLRQCTRKDGLAKERAAYVVGDLASGPARLGKVTQLAIQHTLELADTMNNRPSCTVAERRSRRSNG